MQQFFTIFFAEFEIICLFEGGSACKLLFIVSLYNIFAKFTWVVYARKVVACLFFN